MPDEDAAPARLANRVRPLRRARGLTQADLGALLGVSRQTVNAVENGRYDPGLRLAFDIARVFAARIEDVFRPAPCDTTRWRGVMITIPDRIAGEGVTLRPHRPSDLAAFTRFLSDDAATRYMAFTPEQRTGAGAAAMMDAVIGSYTTDAPICSFTIADPGTGQYLGAVGGAEAGETSMEVFVTVIPAAQGRGIGTSAMRALADHLFATSGVTELRADMVDGHAASMRLFERLGFRRRGPVERAPREGVHAHRGMRGLRYVLTRKDHAARGGVGR